jgi:hypothetical protein
MNILETQECDSVFKQALGTDLNMHRPVSRLHVRSGPQSLSPEHGSPTRLGSEKHCQKGTPDLTKIRQKVQQIINEIGPEGSAEK